MMLLSSSLVLLTAMSGLVLAKTHPGPRPGLSTGMTTEYCYTFYESTSVATVPTLSRTFTGEYTFTRTLYRHPFTLETPALQTETSTSTVTQTSVVSSQVTDTFTLWASTTSTSTSLLSVSTSTSTFTKTIVVSSTGAAAVTLAAPSNFKPIQSSLKGSGDMKKRSLHALAKSRRSVSNKQNIVPIKEMSRAKRHPNHVRCNIYKETPVAATTTSRGSITKTFTLATPTSTVVVEDTSTFTSTSQLGDASSTVLATTTFSTVTSSRPVTTTTTTVMQTDTVVIPLDYQYAMCASNNYANEINNQPIYQLSGVGASSSFAYIGGITKKEDCCNACALNPGCSAAILYSSSNTCDILFHASSTCSSQTDQLIAVYGQYSGLIFMNGYCGMVDTAIPY